MRRFEIGRNLRERGSLVGNRRHERGVASELPKGGSVIQSQTETALETCVRALNESDYREWDEFVLQHPIGTPFHLTSWLQSIEATFGYTPYYLMAMKGDRVTGVLPLFLIENIFL